MNRCAGFTLIELILVIVLLGIMAVGAGMLISRPIESYNDQLRRQQLVDSAAMALGKIATDIRQALPNSIRIVDNSPNGWALEMVNTVDAARYRDDVGGAGYNADYELLDFAGQDREFNVLGRFSTLPVSGLPQSYPDYRSVIYNTNPIDLYDDATNNNEPGIISPPSGIILDVSGNEHHVSIPNPGFQFAHRSPTQRIFLVDGPLSYICDAASGTLTRVDGYAYVQGQIDSVAVFPLTANIGRVATQVSVCDIRYQPGSSERGGLITLDLAVSDNSNESVRLFNQVHVDNVP
jgi:MSHA biogenesis protein MshO